jgi:hypothetical protein
MRPPRAVPVVAFLLLLAASPLGSTPAAPRGLVLRNAQWDAVRVEVRIGASTDCAANASVGTRTVRRRQTWTIVTAQPICWRREQVPGDAARGWTAWSRTQVAANTGQEVDL